MNVMERIAYLSKVAKADKKRRFNKLYKIVQNEEMLSYAWDCIRGNKGIKTAGVDRMNRSGFEERRDEHIASLSTQLRTGEYVPAPVRRVEIPKGNGKGKRPLGIPAIKDRLVQQAVKLILEALYDPLFSDASHGFRPRRSCQTAISEIVPRKFDWVIEGDIKGCFDNIKHSKLLNVLRARIADERFIQLINKFLKSGYQMGFGTDGANPVFATKDGTPQGGIVSPILANIYLHEFDKFIAPSQQNMNREKRRDSKEYAYFQNKLRKLSKALSENRTTYKVELKENPSSSEKGTIVTLNSRDEMIAMVRQLRKERSRYTRQDSELYFASKSLGYVRYADDFVILMGNYHKREAERMKETISEWFSDNLGLTLSQEKTKITHATEGFTFLGYDIIQKPSSKGHGYRNNYALVYTPRVRIKRIRKRLQALTELHSNNPAFDMIVAINRVVSGWSNYHLIANNWSSVANTLDKELYWMLMHWLGRKHKCSIAKVIDSYVVNKIHVYGKTRQRIRAKSGDKPVYMRYFSDYAYRTPLEVANKIRNANEQHGWHSKDDDKAEKGTIGRLVQGNSLGDKLEALASNETCTECGGDAGMQIHHKRMVKRNRRKDALAVIAASRDLLKQTLCQECHAKKHPNTRAING
ncbi:MULTISPECIES: group II intron reverse transcriptase/maturase [unclassified Paenibacillus]|uniref:Group II intron reverse transcriptase/maturase n=1 Tax=Paenibacillus provencensis TaxID=441151 RepID=A0ABW3Q3E2_9BACL|nr:MULTISPECIES: group II intron reverse transcriptase/maturase [unclassified Paenibacillus]MCM3130163.1 group II intron reverse transcriptase/maturase [Paenibacillus sp. MER 78]SDX70860.1 group II intron reverse transcriptase/maturase [Paenibacillus sp. PDC88]SFS88338.1 group II intron reverse transcriptase/maturase [Paenibacillus sp. 453mf]